MPTAFSGRQAGRQCCTPLQRLHPTFSRAAGRNSPSQDYHCVLKCFTIGLKYTPKQPGWCHKANITAISSGERCCTHSTDRIAFNSPCNGEGEESFPLHLHLYLPPSAERRWLLHGGLVAELLCFRRRCWLVCFCLISAAAFTQT